MSTVPQRRRDAAGSPDRWREVKAIFQAALDQPADARGEFVAGACGADTDLRCDVESLLVAAARTGEFMDGPLAHGAPPIAFDEDAERLLAHIGSALGDRYVLQRELARGGMSRVFLAEERAFARLVVVKVLRPDLAFGVSAERFAREVRLTARLQQANIVPVLAAGEVDGLPWYTMPYVRGDSLRTRLASAAPIPIAEGMRILADLAKALAHAHGEGVVHRDIKPENVLLSGGTAVVTDFGIAKAISAARTDGVATRATVPDEPLTRVDVSIGTPGYMSPEQVAGDPDVGPAADVYAFGVLAYELLSGEHPFAGQRSTRALMIAHIKEMPRPLGDLRPELPAAIVDLVMRCLEKDPAMRPADGERLLHALAGAELAGASQPAPWDSDTPSVAVLPFTSLTAEVADQYFSDGVTEEVLTTLTRMRGLRVAARTSSFKDRGLDVRTLARRLGVKTVLEGTVRRSGTRVRISVRLVSAADGLTLWSERYDRDLADIFAVQDEIAEAIARALELAFASGPAATARIASSERGRRDAVNPDAFELYLRGRQLAEQRAEGMHEALRCFERAIELEPDFSPPYAGIAYVFTLFGIYDALRPSEAFPRARDAAERALAIDPADALAHVMRAHVALWYEWDRAAAETRARRALELAPGLYAAHDCLGFVLAAEGRFDEAIASMQRARELDPLSEYATCDLSWVLILAGRWDRAVRELQPAVSRHPEASELRRTYGFCLFYAGRWHEARAEFERALQLNPGNRWASQNLVQALAAIGEADEARRLVSEIQRRADHEPLPLFGIAVMHHWLGDDDAAFRWLERSLEVRDYWLVMLANDPSMARLHGDPRFESVVRRVCA